MRKKWIIITLTLVFSFLPACSAGQPQVTEQPTGQ